MADEQEKGDSNDKKDMFVAPVVTLGKTIVLFLDVATLMIRLLFNTLVHDTPHGKGSVAEE